jgi:hypothetical protein
VGSSEIAPDAVGSSEIAANAVGSSEIATGAVGEDEIATDAVSAVELQVGAVQTAHLVNGAVTSAKLDPALGRGLIPGGFFRSVANSAAVVPGNLSDMTVTVNLPADRLISVHGHARIDCANVGSYAVQLQHDGTIIGLIHFVTVAAAGQDDMVDGAIVFDSGAGDSSAVLTLDVSSGSSGNVVFLGAASNPRTLTVTDLGPA